ncbi:MULTISPECIES: amino acid ABC transporter permease [Kocuria]|uniref:Amino acid ABC transporter permease n=1 Tax=Kocuria subflava TaxID=1736139 RepID=A0A846U6H5_9MICC|nr:MULTISPECIES: amino acid ABC transporter permease [Kocuria]NKE09236.1 amino acid ABC transporter permease [Kocuria subflava]
MSSKAQNVLFDVQGPRGRMLTLIFNIVGVLLVAAIAWYVLAQLGERGQLESSKWTQLFTARSWNNFFIPGIIATLRAAGVAVVLSVIFGLIFGLGRLSQVAVIRGISTVVVEFFRAVPVLVMMIFFYLGLGRTGLVQPTETPFWAVVLALMFYNGSVIAELIRSGVHGLPRGQREAGLVVGLTESQTLRSILLPQALTAMLPSLVSQFVVILKDTALGYIITYPELLASGRRLGSGDGNILQTLLMAAVIFVVINFALTSLAQWLSGFLSYRTSGKTKTPDAPAPAAPTPAK